MSDCSYCENYFIEVDMHFNSEEHKQNVSECHEQTTQRSKDKIEGVYEWDIAQYVT